ncbi:MAG: carboxylesterase/lipase family protein [Microthrixaceae bacterium]
MADSAETIEVTAPRGAVRGRVLDGMYRFAGIPFAEAPTGDRRFRPPVPKAPHEGVLDATEFGAVAPQNPSMLEAMFGSEPERWDEDCLHLNIWTPDVSPAEPLPVMVWIHGGAFEIGSGSSPIYDGAAFARDGVILVTINYRLGCLGFMELGHLDPELRGSGNTGLLDQAEALRWVAENISAFGGDPSNVTIFGESAGSMSVCAQLVLADSRGLFHKAIAQSGGLSAPAPVDLAEETTAEFMATAGISSLDELRAAPAEDLLAAHLKMATERMAHTDETIARHGHPLGYLPFRPVADGTTVPADPMQEVRRGATAQVPLLIGTNLDEWNLFALMAPGSEDRDALRARLAAIDPNPDAVLAAYETDHPGASVGALESSVFTDVVFRAPASQLAAEQAKHAPVWQYRFDWPSPAMDGALGAAHVVEIPFVFDMVGEEQLALLLGAEPPTELSSAVHGAWVSFARDSVPEFSGVDWPALDGGPRKVLRMDVDSEVITDPQAASLDAWSQ